MAEINLTAYDELSMGEISSKMRELKKTSPLRYVETSNCGYLEIVGERVVPIGLENSPEFRYYGVNGKEGIMSLDEATYILKKEKDLKTDTYLKSRGISRQDVRGFLEYLAMSVSWEKKIHPELYEGGK